MRGRQFGGPINVALPVRVCVVAGREIVLHDADASVVLLPRIHCKFTEAEMVCAKRQSGFVRALVIEITERGLYCEQLGENSAGVTS